MSICSLAYELEATQRRPAFFQVTRVNSRCGSATDDSIVDSVLVVSYYYYYCCVTTCLANLTLENK